MAALTHTPHAHIRTTPKGVCGIVQSCTAHKVPIVGFVQTENPRKEFHRPGVTDAVEQTGIAWKRKTELEEQRIFRNEGILIR
jgi:hypothetical protein